MSYITVTSGKLIRMQKAVEIPCRVNKGNTMLKANISVKGI